MRKKKKQGNPLPLLLVQLLGILLALFTLLASLGIWIGWVFCELSYARHTRSPDPALVGLQPDELDELARYGVHMETAERRLAAIEEEGRHLRRRRDGMFHAGSALGKRLNEEVSGLIHSLSDIRAMRDELLSLPGERLREWCIPLTRLLACRWAMSVYLMSCTYGLTVKPSAVRIMDGMIRGVFPTQLPALQLPLYGALALASITASLAGVGAYLLYHRYLYARYAA